MAVAPPHRYPGRLVLSFLLLLFFFITLAAAQQSDQPATATNTSDYPQHVSDNDRNVLAILALNQPIDLQNLTSKAFDAVDHSPNANGSHPLGGGLADVFPGSTGNLTNHAADGPIAFISCDNSSYPPGMLDMNRTLTDAIAPGTNTSAIVLYSTVSSFCVLGPLPQQVADFGILFTTTTAMTSFRLQQALRTQPSSPGYARTSILSMTAWNSQVNAARGQMAPNGFNNPEPGTTVAMIILYSITGVIALLFVVIIITGAVRAHRHPERYGPRNVVGRPRQNRAVGIGRAMLETLPLVRFGETQPAPKPADVEMNPMDGANATGRRTSSDAREVDASPAVDAQHPASTTATPANAGATTARAEGAGKDAASQALNHQEKVEKSLECAICWDDFEKGEEVRVLPCEHKFHPKCIDPWLLGFSGTCPVCRIEFGKQDKEDKPEEGASSSQQH